MSHAAQPKWHPSRAGKMNLRVIMILGAVLLLTTAAAAQKPVAELPRVHIDTTWNEPKTGTAWRAHTAAELSNALAKSVPGDIIVLDSGVTYSGTFQLPAKANPNNKWIYIVSSAIASLPSGRRVSPSNSSSMPKIVTPNVAPAFQVHGGANHWRLVEMKTKAAPIDYHSATNKEVTYHI